MLQIFCLSASINQELFKAILAKSYPCPELKRIFNLSNIREESHLTKSENGETTFTVLLPLTDKGIEVKLEAELQFAHNMYVHNNGALSSRFRHVIEADYSTNKSADVITCFEGGFVCFEEIKKRLHTVERISA